MTEVEKQPGALRRLVMSPALLVLVLAPFLGEGLSGSTPPLTLLLPWNLAFMVALYGCGALVCRELAHRFGLGFAGLVLLGVAYAIWEEGLVDRYWFLESFWEDSGIGDYGVVWHTNVLLAAHLTVFHTVVSIGTSVLVVEWLRPLHRDRPWIGRPGLVVAGIVLAATPIVYGELDQSPPAPVLVVTAVLLVLVVAAAFVVGRRASTRPPPDRRGRSGRWLGTIAFAGAAAHWVLTYSVPSTGLPWPAGVALALLPVLVGAVLVRRLSRTGPYGHDGARVVAGVLIFFVALDCFVAVLGVWDMVLSALLAAWLARTIVGRAPEPALTP